MKVKNLITTSIALCLILFVSSTAWTAPLTAEQMYLDPSQVPPDYYDYDYYTAGHTAYFANVQSLKVLPPLTADGSAYYFTPTVDYTGDITDTNGSITFIRPGPYFVLATYTNETTELFDYGIECLMLGNDGNETYNWEKVETPAPDVVIVDPSPFTIKNPEPPPPTLTKNLKDTTPDFDANTTEVNDLKTWEEVMSYLLWRTNAHVELLGHGNKGSFFWDGNEVPIEDFLKLKEHVSYLTFISCLTGAGQEGSNFIIDIAMVLGKAGAYTGKLMQNGKDLFINDGGYLKIADLGGEATDPNPPDIKIDILTTPILSWTPGAYADTHDVYFGTNFNDVNDANRTNDPCGVLVKQDHDSNSIDIADSVGILQFDTTYYWRVDEVNEPNIWKGDVWSFTTANYLVVDDFDSYANDEALWAVWSDGWSNGTGSEILLDTDPNFTHDGNSLKYYYDNSGHLGMAYFSEIEADTGGPNSLEVGSDWTRLGIKALSLWFYGDPGNDIEPMWVKLEDTTASSYAVGYGDYGEDLNDVNDPAWHEWNIDLQDFSNGGVDLNDVSKLTIGFGDRDNPTPGGSGTVYFDDIRLYPPRCVPELLKPVADFTNDCLVDLADLEIMTLDWLADVFFDLGHTALGQALLSPVPEGLSVSNIGSSGNDGLIIALPDNLTLWEADILDLGDPNDPLNPIPDGAFIEVTSRGIVDGLPDMVVSVVRHEDTGAQVTTTADFSALAPNSLTANYYLYGELVLTEENIDPCEPYWLSGHWTLDIALDWHWGFIPYPTVGWCWVPDYPPPWLPPLPPWLKTPQGNTVQADRVQVSAMDIAVPFDGYSDVSVKAVDIPSFTITDEVVELSAGRTFTSTDITGDGSVNFKDFAVFANMWLEEHLWPPE